MQYILLPLISWCSAGFFKILLYFFRYKKIKPMEFFRYGGFPSAHTSLITAPVFYAGLTEGFFTPVFSIGFALLLIIITDAHGLRRYVGHQAKIVNQIQKQTGKSYGRELKEQVGHSWSEILGGLFNGICWALLTFWLFGK